jgi:predicted DNA-binding protein (UPF0251 family)
VSDDVFGNLPASAVEQYLQAVEEGELPLSPGADGDLSPESPPHPVLDQRQQDRQLLQDLGLLKPAMDRPVLVPVDPETAAAQQERRATQELARAAALRDRWQPLTTAYRSARAWHDETSLARYVEDKEAIGQALQLRLSEPLKLLRTMQPGAPRPPELLKGSIAQELEMRRRGVQRQILYEDRQRHHAPTGHYVRTVTAAGVEVRTVPVLPWDRLFIFDDLVMYPKDGNNDIAVFNREPSVVSFMNRLFEAHWQRAAPFEEQPEELELTAEQRYAVRLLVGGMSVENIAARMGVAVRTVNRLLAEARKALGVHAPAELGWVLRGKFPHGLPADW